MLHTSFLRLRSINAKGQMIYLRSGLRSATYGPTTLPLLFHEGLVQREGSRHRGLFGVWDRYWG